MSQRSRDVRNVAVGLFTGVVATLALGQAAGTAAALAARDGVPVAEVAVDELQGSLSKQGAIL